MAKKKNKKKAEHYRTGQYVKPKRTGKVTTNLSQEEWETDTSKPITSRTGVIGHQKKLKKKGELYPKVKIEDLPTSRKQRMSPKERRELIGMGVNPADIKGTVAYKKWQREKDRAAKQTPATQAKTGGTVKKHGGGMTDVGLYPAEEARAGVLSERERSRFAKKGGSVKRKAGGTVKKQTGGLTQGYNARLDESLGARNRGTRGNLAARRHESEGMERALGRRPYSAASTMAKKGGSVSRKKGGTTSRKAGGKIMVGYKAGGRV